MKAKTKRRHRKPQHEDGVPSPHGFVAGQTIKVPGGRIHHDPEHDEWVALGLDRVLGRFPTPEQATEAVRQDTERRARTYPPTTDPNSHERDMEDCDDWRS